MAVQIDVPYDAIVAFCRRWNVTEFALFGSVLRDDFRPDSDVDVLVTFAPGKAPGLGFITMQDELESLLGRKVDLITREGIARSRNYLRRRDILSSAQVVYAA